MELAGEPHVLSEKAADYDVWLDTKLKSFLAAVQHGSGGSRALSSVAWIGRVRWGHASPNSCLRT
jgi:hypothetical protein